ncbi:hypothetical protein, partial [Microbulbifer sp. TYP-18]|uniref:hypothetical protein n=1 Tax=Microbulbifer sp. TYP-18 TaxID=3230024 RepID=UPI0034C64B82
MGLRNYQALAGVICSSVRFNLSKYLLFFVSTWCLLPVAVAQVDVNVSVSESNSPDGSYTVSYRGPGTFSERKNGTVINSFVISDSTNRTKTYSNRSTGVYKYSIYWEKTYCFTPPGEALDCQTYTDSDSATVNVARKPGIAGNFENFPSQDDDGVFTVKWGAATGTISRYELHQKKNSGSYSGDIH